MIYPDSLTISQSDCLMLTVPAGTGDLFTALCTAWLTKTEGDLKVSLERTIATMQAVLTRTLSHAKAAAAKAGLEKPTAAMMELKLIQSKADIESPRDCVEATVL